MTIDEMIDELARALVRRRIAEDLMDGQRIVREQLAEVWGDGHYAGQVNLDQRRPTMENPWRLA